MTKEQRSHARHTKQKLRDRREAAHRRNRWLMIGGGTLAVLLIGAFALRPRPQAEAVPEARLTDDPALGSAEAKVTIVEYGDFGCPSCRAWHQAGILTQILEKYGDKVRFVWRDFPVITAQSPKAAEAAQCAYDQHQFWEYHDLLYDRAPALSVSNLKTYAAELGLDTARFNSCLDSGQHQATVARDEQDAFQRGFRGTPSFLVNEQPLVGPPSTETLQNLIDTLLAADGQ
ncbi:MAG: DsbA family protein [Chloroflexota bacterium]